ncbi:MAG TPA: BamA/TamA family outer membrane protein [Kofleriaceae bacterium]|nr:BamA/TamA family outer membrane protein [Kofleriaceae bacterium]
MKALLAACAVLALARTAHADDPPDPPPADPPLSAEDVKGAPRPGQESGRTDSTEPDDTVARKVGRSVLLFPRLPIELVAQPVRGMLYVQDRYDVIGDAIRLFSTEDRRIALFPTALFETGLGLNIGARGYIKDAFGEGERFSARAGFGGEFLWVAVGSVDTGTRLPGGLVASLEGRYAVRDTDRFYGYGNADLGTLPVAPVDPTMDMTAIASRFRVTVARALPRLKLTLPWDASITATAGITRKEFAPNESGGDPPIDAVYEVDRVPGFMTGTTFLYDELQLARDTRGPGDRWDPTGMRSSGGLALAFAGRQQGLGDGEPTFYRVGFDLQQYLRLTRAARVLQLRAYGEMVTGDRDRVPFSELPRLGGPSFLRGYPSDRFRDRVALIGQASYTWAAATWLAPSVFVDVGRVYSGLDALTLDHPRAGYGLSIEMLGTKSLVLRAELATSIDGDVAAYVAFNPAFDARTRERY